MSDKAGNALELIPDPSTLTAEQLIKITTDDKSYMEDSKYGPGGYMPIEISQRLGPNGEYRIIRKLGWGAYATVWLGQEDRSKDYYALKIIKSSRNYKASAQREIQLLEYIKTKNTNDTVGSNRLVLLNKYFTEQSLRNRHLCLVSEVMGPSLLELLNQNNYNSCDEQGAKLIIKQVTEGVRFLHEECGIIHADIKSSNILISVKDSYAPTLAAYVEQFNRLNVPMPRSYATSLKWLTHLERLPCIPAVKDAPLQVKPFLDDYCLGKRPKKGEPGLFINPNISIKLTDLGCAFFERSVHPAIIQARNLRALEVSLEAPYSYPVDMWTIGCLAYELLTGEYLYKLDDPFKIPATLSDMKSIWQILGGIPEHVALSGKRSLEFFNLDGSLKNVQEQLPRERISEKLISKRDFTFEHALQWEDFILSLLAADPSERATASTALADEWLIG